MLYKVQKKRVAMIAMAAMLSNSSIGAIKVFANELNNDNQDMVLNLEEEHIKRDYKKLEEAEGIKVEGNVLLNEGVSLLSEIETNKKANITRFDLQNNEKIDEYNDKFKLDNSNIEKVTTNGGHYPHSQIEKAFDGKFETHWETGRRNTEDFTNELTITLKEITELDRIVYAARKDGANGKGFAQQVEIYSSLTDEGNDFQLVASGEYAGSVADLVEIQFQPTEFKRLKFVFKKAHQDWASASEIMLYKEDSIRNEIGNLFTSNAMDEVNPKFASMEKLEALEQEAKLHPLYDLFKTYIEDAKSVVSGEIKNIKTITAEQQGDRDAHAWNNLKMRFGNNHQPTGILALPGNTVTVYVDVEPGKPVPKLLFSQQEGSWSSWGKVVQLKPGRNDIVVPKVEQDKWYGHSVTPGGPIYIINPYTPEQQGKAPTLRFATGVEKFPFYDKNTNEQEFLDFLVEYKEKVEEDAAKNPNVMDRKMIDTVEIVSDHIVLTVTTGGAYDAYINKGFKPSETVKMYNEHLDMLFEYLGLDGRNEKNDIKYSRENIRLAQPYGYMYASGDHIGVQGDVMSSLLTTVNGWGINHEIGHNTDIPEITISEVANNMLPQYASYKYNTLDERIPFENEIYKNVISTNNNKYEEGGLSEQIAPFWQLEMVYPGYWGKFNSIYRENDIKVSSHSDKLDKMAYYSSMALQLDLSEYFERHGFPVSENTKEFTKQYNKPEKKIWYSNYEYIKYNGEGFKQDPNVQVSKAKQGENIKLSFNVDESSKNDVLGYEIFKNDELIGFTSTNSFLDTTTKYTDNVTYKIVPFDKKLNEGKAVEISSYQPTLSLEQNQLTLKLGEEFIPENFVKAYNYKGEDITNLVKINGSFDTNKKGNYELVYTITDENLTSKEILKIEVVSDYDYLSDYDWKLAETQFESPRKNTRLKGRVNGDIKTFEKGFGIHANGKIVYDLTDKNYDTFEALVGVDMNIAPQNNSSIQFKILGDGKELASTKVIKHADNMVYINVPVKDVKELIIEISDAGNGRTSDHAVIVNPKLVNNNVKPTLNVEDVTTVKLNSDFNIMENVTAIDIEDGDLTDKIVVNSEGFNIDKTGEYTITYTVEDSDKNIITKERKVIVYSEDTYLSDINWESARTDYGNVNKDKSSTNKEIKLLVDGEVKTFEKGIGTHANSEIVYDLTDKNYEYFETYIGVDRNIEEQRNSSIIFKILADGKEVYNSGIMNYNTEAKKVNIPIKDVKKLELIVNDANGSISSDHGSFGDARFLTLNSVPKLTIPDSISTKVGEEIDLNQEFKAIDAEDGDITNKVEVIGIDNVDFNKVGKYDITYKVTDSDGNEVIETRNVAVVDMNDFKYLTEYNWSSTKFSYAQPVKDKSTSHNALRLTDENGAEVIYEKGIGSHATSEIVYDLTDKDYAYFTSFVGVDRQMFGSVGSVTFEVYVDGVKKFDSGLMNSRDAQKYVEVDINGAKELKLVVTDGGNGIGSDHATWGDTKLHFVNPKQEVPETEARKQLKELVEKASQITEDMIGATNHKGQRWENFTNQLKVSKEMLENASITDEEINTAIYMLNYFIEELQIKQEVEESEAKKELRKLVEDASEIIEDMVGATNHKEQRWSNFTNQLEACKQLLNNENATDEEINTAIYMLNYFIEELQIKDKEETPEESEVKKELRKLVEDASEITEDMVGATNHKEQRWSNFTNQLEACKQLLNNENATDKEINTAIYMLNYFIEELEIINK